MADLAVPADLIATVTMEGTEIVGRPVAEVFPAVVVRLVAVLMDTEVLYLKEEDL